MENTTQNGTGTLDAIAERVKLLRTSFDEGIRYAQKAVARRAAEYLLVNLGDERYAFSIANILEVISVPTIVPLPGVPVAILGIVNFRGRIISAITIHEMLGLVPRDVEKRGRLVITKRLAVDTGIMADRVYGIVEIDLDKIQPVPVTVRDERARYLEGQVYLGADLVTLVDLQQICASERVRING